MGGASLGLHLLVLAFRFGKIFWRIFLIGHSTAPELELAYKRILVLSKKTISQALALIRDMTLLEKGGSDACKHSYWTKLGS